MLFELLTGEHPFKRGTLSDTIAAILRDAPSRAGGSGDPIDYAIFDKLLAKTSADRYQSFDEVSVEVRRLRDATSAWTEPLSEPADTTEPPVGARRTPFVGREDERAELGRWLDRAVRGRGGLVLIGGEPGVGKTRLVEQLLDVARQQRCLTLTGRCYEMEGTAPFIPFVEIIEQYARVVPPAVLREALGDASPEVARLVPGLRRLFPDIPPALELPPEQQRHYLFKNVAEFFERVSRVSSTVLLLDDLQWADNATLLLLQHLAPTLGEQPLLALGTYRDVELDVNRPFAATLEILNRKRLAQRLNLQRLPQEGVAAMLAALGGSSPPAALVAGIYRETEGNPFFVEEVFQHLEEEEALHGDQRRIADLRYNKGQALRSLGRWEAALEEWKKALSVYEEMGDRVACATVYWETAYLLVWTARGAEAAGVARRGLEVLGSEASADRCRLLAIGGWALGNAAERSDEVVAGDEMLSPSTAMAEALGDPRAHREALLSSAYKHFLCMRSPEQAEAALRAAEMLRFAGDLWNLADALTLFQLASVFRGRLDGSGPVRGGDRNPGPAPRQPGGRTTCSVGPRTAGLVGGRRSRPVRGVRPALCGGFHQGGHALRFHL